MTTTPVPATPSIQMVWGLQPTSDTPNEPVLFLERRLTQKQLDEIERRKKLSDARFGKAAAQAGAAFTTISNADVFLDDPDDDFQAQSFAFHGGKKAQPAAGKGTATTSTTSGVPERPPSVNAAYQVKKNSTLPSPPSSSPESTPAIVAGATQSAATEST